MYETKEIKFTQRTELNYDNNNNNNLIIIYQFI